MTTSSGSGCEGGKAEGLSEGVVEGVAFSGIPDLDAEASASSVARATEKEAASVT